MKILPFNPSPPKAAEGRRKDGEGPAGPPGPSFGAELEKAGRGPSPVVEKITLANRLASQGAAVEDVDEAGALLASLVGRIRSAGPEALQKVHNLDGLLYCFQG
jgi:hypothetical protein